MNHRHLLDNEIDLLLDEEVGFGVAPLRAHVEACAQCRAALERDRAVFEELDGVGHIAPSHGFADRVMARTRVFEPWHVTALDTLRRWVPASGPARVAAAFAASIAGLVLTTIMAWAVTRADELSFFAQLGIVRFRLALLAGVRDLATSVLGADAADAIATSGVGSWGALALAAIATAVVSALLLRRIAAASARARE